MGASHGSGPGLASHELPVHVTPREVLRPLTTVLEAVLPAVLVGLLGALSLASFEQRGLGVALLLVQTVPLTLRARLPVPVLVVTAAGTMTQLLLGLPPTNAMLGQAVATATVVARSRWPSSLVPPSVLVTLTLSVMWLSDTPGLAREAVIQVTTFAVAWALGDARARRAAVQRSVEQELAARTETNRLGAQLAAVRERLRIARELHDLVGAGLDGIAVQAAAARLRLPRREAVDQIMAIESIGRAVLAELDRFLGLLRREPEVPDEPAAATGTEPVAVGTDERLPWLQRHRAAVFSAGPALVVGGLAMADAVSTPPQVWPGTGWVVLHAGAVGLPLLVRQGRPEVATVLVACASAVPLLAGVPVADGVLALPVALHALASYRTRGRALLAAVAGVALLVALAAAYDQAYAVQLGVVLAVFSGAAVYVGDTARIARARDDSLTQRLTAVHEDGRLREVTAVGEERTAAARDLHDSIGHTVSLIVLQAGAARLAVAASPEGWSTVGEVLSGVEDLAREALGDMDDLVASAASAEPPTDDVLRTGEDIRHLAGNVRAAGTPVELGLGDLDGLPQSLQAAVYRIVQESLTNVVKHAPGGPAQVTVERRQDVVRVVVTNPMDAGPTSELPSGARGLVGLRERVALFGGDLAAGPDGHGLFVVQAALPVPSQLEPSRTGAHP